MNTAQLEKWESAVRALVTRAQKDRSFHARCQEDPAKAFRQAAGFDLPSGLTLRCLEVDPDELVVPLPPLCQGNAGGQLSEEDLDQIAGGTTTGTVAAVITTAFVAAAFAGIGWEIYKSATR